MNGEANEKPMTEIAFCGSCEHWKCCVFRIAASFDRDDKCEYYKIDNRMAPIIAERDAAVAELNEWKRKYEKLTKQE